MAFESEQDTPRSGRPADPADVFFAERLQNALRRVDAPDDFTDRVMARAATDVMKAPRSRGRLLSFPQTFGKPVWRAAYAAAALLAITAGTLHLDHQRVERRKTEMAAAQFDQAMQVTGHALDHVSAQLERSEFGAVQRALESQSGGER